ncbi:type II toxin-antitoxin system VapC family toxin [Halomarina litorea]|uniref:type II toxin-antitoxin system VapC family toxin n=1 Tax=Halomarina litorea TaxID=2961595 RepID=UPI0020C53504|nr:type II toxin-antitoxin system VapC family toxin [Halomarina sp. BCD28]
MGEYFLDTSALVKRYHEEPGTETIDRILDAERNHVVISSLSVVEAASAFRRKHNRGELTEVEMEGLVGAFFAEALDEFVIVPLADVPQERSLDLVLVDDLRTLDSLQLATALDLAESVEDLQFVCADRELVAVAANHGIETVVP